MLIPDEFCLNFNPIRILAQNSQEIGAKIGAQSRGRCIEECCINLGLLKVVTFNGYKINNARKDYSINVCEGKEQLVVLTKNKKWKILFS